MDSNKTKTSSKNREHEHCNHASLIKEFAYGAPTGNYICSDCQRLLSSIVTEQKH